MRVKKSAAEIAADHGLIDEMLRAHLAAEPAVGDDMTVLAAYDALKAALEAPSRDRRDLAKLAVTSLVCCALGEGKWPR